MARSGPFISAIFASRSASPSALPLRCDFSSAMRSFIAARSSAVSPFDPVSVRLAPVWAPFFAGFLSAIVEAPPRWSTRRFPLHTSTGRRAPGSTRCADVREPALEEATLVVRVRELERTRVLGARLVGAVEAAEQVGACGVEVLVSVEVEPVDEGEADGGTIHLRDGDRSVQLHDGRAGQED